PRWQSGPRANDQHLKQVLGGTSPSSGSRDLITEDEPRLAALHGNNIEQEAASYPRSQHKSGASRSTPSRQIVKKRATQKKMAATSPPVPSSTASRVKR